VNWSRPESEDHRKPNGEKDDHEYQRPDDEGQNGAKEHPERRSETDSTRPYDSSTEVRRPGVSKTCLREQQIRHLDEAEAESLLGFKPSGGGTWIPYAMLSKPGLMVNGRPFGRLRLDRPTGDAKYLSQPRSGAQLYIPQGSVPFGKELVIAEGEFKALALHQEGIRAVALGGISSAMPRGKLLPDLLRILTKYHPNTVYFLGDADTCLIFAFSLEAVKLAKALPQACTLKLPRIPLGFPNGIDDCREKLGDGLIFAAACSMSNSSCVKHA
jgi:hypothetical protein